MNRRYRVEDNEFVRTYMSNWDDHIVGFEDNQSERYDAWVEFKNTLRIAGIRDRHGFIQYDQWYRAKVREWLTIEVMFDGSVFVDYHEDISQEKGYIQLDPPVDPVFILPNQLFILL